MGKPKKYVGETYSNPWDHGGKDYRWDAKKQEYVVSRGESPLASIKRSWEDKIKPLGSKYIERQKRLTEEAFRQKEKYNRMNEIESVDIPETEDFYSIGKMAQDQVDANSDWSKTWGIDSSKFPVKDQISFKAARDESHWVTPTDTFTNTTLERTSAFTAAVSNPANSTKLGGMNYLDPAIRKETNKNVDNNIVSQVASTTTPKMTTTEWTTDQGVNDPGVTTDLNLPEKQDPKVTQWYDLEGEDGGAAAKQMALKKKSELAAIEAQQVKIDGNKIQTNQAKLPTGVLPESTRSSWLSDFFNNRRGGK